MTVAVSASSAQPPAALLRCFIGQIKRFRVPSSSSSAPPGPGVPTPDTSEVNCKLFCPETVWWLRRKSALAFCVQVSAPPTLLLLGWKCRDNGHKMSSNFGFPIKYTRASTLKEVCCALWSSIFVSLCMHTYFILHFTFWPNSNIPEPSCAGTKQELKVYVVLDPEPKTETYFIPRYLAWKSLFARLPLHQAGAGDLRLPGPGLTFPRTLEPELQPGPGQELATFMFITSIFTIFGKSPSEEIPTFL